MLHGQEREAALLYSICSSDENEQFRCRGILTMIVNATKQLYNLSNSPYLILSQFIYRHYSQLFLFAFYSSSVYTLLHSTKSIIDWHPTFKRRVAWAAFSCLMSGISYPSLFVFVLSIDVGCCRIELSRFVFDHRPLWHVRRRRRTLLSQILKIEQK
jgi:hypothetical protein